MSGGRRLLIYDDHRYARGFLFPSEAKRVQSGVMADLEKWKKALEVATAKGTEPEGYVDVFGPQGVTHPPWVLSTVTTFHVRYTPPAPSLSLNHSIEALIEGSDMSRLTKRTGPSYVLCHGICYADTLLQGTRPQSTKPGVGAKGEYGGTVADVWVALRSCTRSRSICGSSRLRLRSSTETTTPKRNLLRAARWTCGPSRGGKPASFCACSPGLVFLGCAFVKVPLSIYRFHTHTINPASPQ